MERGYYPRNGHSAAQAIRQWTALFCYRGTRMGSAVAAILIMKEKALVEHFRQQGALTAATAKTLNALSISENVEFRRLRVRAVIREGAAGAYYLDEESWTAVRRTRQRVLTVLLIAAAGVAIAFVVFARGGVPS